MPAVNKTERITAADFKKSKQKSAAPALAPLTVFPIPAPGLEPRSYSFTYLGQGLSSNKWYAGVHFRTRLKMKEEWRAKFHPLIVAANIEAMERFKLAVRYRAKLDPDNVTAMCKIALDLLKGWFVPDDSPKYFKGFSIEFDETLRHNTFTFTLIEQP